MSHHCRWRKTLVIELVLLNLGNGAQVAQISNTDMWHAVSLSVTALSKSFCKQQFQKSCLSLISAYY